MPPKNTGSASGTYSFSELEQLWMSAGGAKIAAPMAAAIALAESGGDPNAHSPTNDYGLWQINSVNAADCVQGGCYNPASNAKAAVKLSNNGATWKPWCTAWSDGACGTKGGTYLGSSSPAMQKLKANGGNNAANLVPSQQQQNAQNTVAQNTSKQTNQNQSNPSGGTTCAWQTPSVFGLSGCILTKTQVRQLVGGVLILTAGAWVVVGLAMIAYGAGKNTPVGQAAGKVVGGAAKMTGTGMAIFAAPEAAPEILAAQSAAGRRGLQAAGRKAAGARQERRVATGEHRAATYRAGTRARAVTQAHRAETYRVSEDAQAKTARYNAGTAREYVTGRRSSGPVIPSQQT